MSKLIMRNECQRILHNSTLFQFVEKDIISDMLDAFQQENWARRRIVSGEDVQDRFHIILKGRLKMTRINEETGRMAGQSHDIFSL